MPRPITPDQKVEEVLTAYPQTLEVFVGFGFTPLKNPMLRRTMAPLITVRGAARTKGWGPDQLDRFVAALEVAAACPVPAPPASEEGAAEPLPYDLRDVAGLRAQGIVVEPHVVRVDNRGLEPPEPLVRILSIAPQLAVGQRLEAVNVRKPLLLYPRLEALGLAHRTEELPDGTFRITVEARA